MSGILGLFDLDGAPVEPAELRDMASLLTRRGPDRTGIWRAGPIGLGHTLLATTPEMLFEQLPLEHGPSGCAITADVRLDNRSELLAALGLGARASVTGDAEIVLTAYLEWGEACVERFLGDFAFAIWDPRGHRLFCARDHMGMRQLIYHHSPGRFFAFATDPRAILVLPQTPYRINEARIADYLVQGLEGVDKTSTFFADVFCLPPAHVMSVSRGALSVRPYWTPKSEPTIGIGSRQSYAEAFFETFSEAVRCRLRTVGPVGSTLSGGLDSGSVVAVASQLLAAEGRGPLHTFSGVSPDGAADPETRAIRVGASMNGLDPHTVSYGQVRDLRPSVAQLAGAVEEPFDASMTLVRTVYLAAHRRGLRMLLDGVGADVVLSEGRRFARLLRSGRWTTAYREASGHNQFWGGAYPPGRELARSARAAFVPNTVLRRLRPLRQQRRADRLIRDSLISEDFASRFRVRDRIQRLERHREGVRLSDLRAERIQSVDHPYLTRGRERYDRVGAAVGIEPRDPFLDLRVLNVCVQLPDECLLEGGWPKAILRRAMVGRLPDAVLWRRGKEHLGWAYTEALMNLGQAGLREDAANLERICAYVDVHAARSAYSSYLELGDSTQAEAVYTLSMLERWLVCHANRPKIDVRPNAEG